MKSKLLLVLAAAFLLVGCNEAEVPAEESASGEGTQQSTSEGSSESNSEGGETSESSSEDMTGKKTLSVTFLNNTAFPTGGYTDKNYDGFISAFNGDTDVLESYTATENNLTQIINNTDNNWYIKRTLQLGSRSGEGEIEFNFKYSVTKITFVFQAYWKCYKNNGTLTYNVDEYANVSVNSDANYVDLSAQAGKEPDMVTKTFNFDSVKKVKVYNEMNNSNVPDKQGQRAYVHSMEITYIE